MVLNVTAVCQYNDFTNMLFTVHTKPKWIFIEPAKTWEEMEGMAILTIDSTRCWACNGLDCRLLMCNGCLGKHKSSLWVESDECVRTGGVESHRTVQLLIKVQHWQVYPHTAFIWSCTFSLSRKKLSACLFRVSRSQSLSTIICGVLGKITIPQIPIVLFKTWKLRKRQTYFFEQSALQSQITDEILLLQTFSLNKGR